MFMRVLFIFLPDTLQYGGYKLQSICQSVYTDMDFYLRCIFKVGNERCR